MAEDIGATAARTEDGVMMGVSYVQREQASDEVNAFYDDAEARFELLLNIFKVFGHNGHFRTLYDIVHFYNTRDVGDWPPPEVAANVNDDELGDLGLSLEEERALVAFLKTLSDGYVLETDRAESD